MRRLTVSDTAPASHFHLRSYLALWHLGRRFLLMHPRGLHSFRIWEHQHGVGQQRLVQVSNCTNDSVRKSGNILTAHSAGFPFALRQTLLGAVAVPVSAIISPFADPSGTTPTVGVLRGPDTTSQAWTDRVATSFAVSGSGLDWATCSWRHSFRRDCVGVPSIHGAECVDFGRFETTASVCISDAELKSKPVILSF